MAARARTTRKCPNCCSPPSVTTHPSPTPSEIFHSRLEIIMSTTALPDQVRWFQGRLWHQQRDLVRRRSGRPQLRVQTWVYRGDGDGFAEWPAFYSYESRP